MGAFRYNAAMTDKSLNDMTDEEKQLWAEFEECGILKVRNNLEDGDYGAHGSPTRELAEYWLEKQHLKQYENVTSLKDEPKRLAAVIFLLLLFFGLFYYIFAY